MDNNQEKIAREVAEVIKEAFTRGASDIHVECFETEALIRFRIDGVLRVFKKLPSDKYSDYRDNIKTMACMDLQERRVPQDGRIRLNINDKNLDLRVSTVPCAFGESIVFRILDRSSIKLNIDQVGFNETQLGILKRWYSQPHGIILVTGPTGSGKTTVLYSILNTLNDESIKICSIEDPIEYTFPGINQIAISPKIGLTFSQSIRAVMRQDPDVILVGEIRDLQTSQMIIQTALTGHLALSTLHTNTATEGVIRMRDMGLEPFLIKDTLIGITSQRLVRKLCQHCREEYEPEALTLEYLGLSKQAFYRAKGCENCNNFGYRGRTAIYELFEWTNGCKNLLLRNCNDNELRRQAISEGMATLWQDGISKAVQGVTSLEEILRVIGTLRPV